MIHLVDIDPSNWRLDLKVAESQKKYVANSAVMMARAYAYREQRSRAFVIYDDETPVGMGMYHDKESFEAFSHRRSIIATGTWIDLPFRYMPYKMFGLVKKIL